MDTECVEMFERRIQLVTTRTPNLLVSTILSVTKYYKTKSYSLGNYINQKKRPSVIHYFFKTTFEPNNCNFCFFPWPYINYTL